MRLLGAGRDPVVLGDLVVHAEEDRRIFGGDERAPDPALHRLYPHPRDVSDVGQGSSFPLLSAAVPQYTVRLPPARYYPGMDQEQFSYRITKGRKVFIEWRGRTVAVLKGRQAEKLIGELPRMNREQEQLALAKVTGNFKRGNERRGR